ncbi:MAG: DUF2160 domain-containing protein [Paracoccaceae bacterium]
MRKVLGALLAYLVALGAGAGVAWCIAPEPWRAPVEAWLIARGLLEEPAPAAATGGWGAAATASPATGPELVPLAWMAWTPETGAFFLFVLMCLALMTGREIVSPGGNPRRGLLGLDTTRGDRLFISLLGSAYILLAWLGILGSPLWGAVGLAALWAIFVFWKA